MLRLLSLLSLMALACAEGKPAKSADFAADGANDGSSDSAPAPAEDSTEAASKEASSEKAAGGEKQSAPAAPASQNDAQEVLQLVIDDEALNAYLHLDKADRFPLRIAGSVLPANIELTKATKPVVVVPNPDGDKKPLLVFTELKIEGDEASVRYRYDVEKVRGSASLKRREGHWVLARSRVTEH